MPTSSVNRVPRNDDRRESILISPLFILFVTVKRIEWLVVRLGILRYRPQWPCWNTASFFETQRSFALVATSRVAVVSLCRRQEWQSEFSFLKRWGIRGENRRWEPLWFADRSGNVYGQCSFVGNWNAYGWMTTCGTIFFRDNALAPKLTLDQDYTNFTLSLSIVCW